MAFVYDYSQSEKEGVNTIEIKNVVKTSCPNNKACDAGNQGIKRVVEYDSIKDNPCVKFEYLLNEDGSFAKGEVKNGGYTIKTGEEASSAKYLVVITEKFKHSSRYVPGYRTANSKILYADESGKGNGDSMKFTTTNKDEVVFYEKLAYAFKGDLAVTINGFAVGNAEDKLAGQGDRPIAHRTEVGC